ncbi:nuclear transport factor 2 family protein [Aspergillus stella-maris]|uniref:nuclear transport factor 2 family protein n=1 Tax=Aspergillus stella-maris TaxID=1810926 RepID=UPI003CCCB751
MHLSNLIFLVPCLLAQVTLGLSFPILERLFPSPPIDDLEASGTDQPNNLNPIPLYNLPSLFPSSPAVDSSTTETIRKTLALYPLAIDGKNFTALSSVFAPDAVANFSSPLGVLSPLSDIQETLRQSLTCVTTQHSLGTQLIDVLDVYRARSVTYYTAEHFRRSEEGYGVVTAHGQYQDEWVRMGDGTWRIVVRNLVFMSEIMGDQSIFVC